jgi:hypothetical protein
MELSIGKILALLVAIGYCISALVITREAGFVVVLTFPLLFVLSLIWFPETWGERIDGRITRETPAAAVAFGGWVLLIALPLVLYWLKFRAH